MGVLIMQGAASFRLDPVLPEPVAALLRLAEPARRMADLTRTRADGSKTFNVWHETLELSPLDGLLLPLLDGTRDRDALIDALVARLREDPDHLDPDGTPVLDEASMRTALAEHVDTLPQRLTEMKLVRFPQ
jgi:hypothetical protein